MKKASAAVLAAAAGLKQSSNPDRLQTLRNKIREARDIELELAGLTERQTERQAALRRILGGGHETGELVALFDELGLSALTLEADGNVPAYEAEVTAFYSAGIPKDPELAAAALSHIEKVWKMPDLIKTSISADFGRGERSGAKKLEGFLKKSKVDYSSKVGVHGQTLTAEIRRRFQSGKPLSPKELSTVGGFVGTIVKLSKRETEDGK